MYYRNEAVRYADAIQREQGVQRRVVEGMEASRWARLLFIADLLSLNLKEHALRVEIVAQEAKQRAAISPAARPGRPLAGVRSRSLGRTRMGVPAQPKRSHSVGDSERERESHAMQPGASGEEARSFLADDAAVSYPAAHAMHKHSARLAQGRWVFLREERLARAAVAKLEGEVYTALADRLAQAFPTPRARYPLTPRCAREAHSRRDPERRRGKDAAIPTAHSGSIGSHSNATPNTTPASQHPTVSSYLRNGAVGCLYVNTPGARLPSRTSAVPASGKAAAQRVRDITARLYTTPVRNVRGVPAARRGCASVDKQPWRTGVPVDAHAVMATGDGEDRMLMAGPDLRGELCEAPLPTPIMAPTPVRDGIELDPHLPGLPSEMPSSPPRGTTPLHPATPPASQPPTTRDSPSCTASWLRGGSSARGTPPRGPSVASVATSPSELTQRLHSQLRRECRQLENDRWMLRVAALECQEQERRASLITDEMTERTSYFAYSAPPPPERQAASRLPTFAVVLAYNLLFSVGAHWLLQWLGFL
eukprot:TRINITY_DN21389_c0_g1_i1.p1 TRINITY_DN21389_c0_g1~~TRINITY_DN21389_c0_g1_i1.p1  ORF type:complete len:536 (+),score=43.46 TRINITY_DN21389_c0_g1_i1:41-1648(+)